MKEEEQQAKRLEEKAEEKLLDAQHEPDQKKRESLCDNACVDLSIAAAIHAGIAADYHENGDLDKARIEHIKSAQDYEKCGKIKYENDRERGAELCFQNTVRQYQEARNPEEAIRIINEYSQTGTRRQLRLELTPLPSYDI